MKWSSHVEISSSIARALEMPADLGELFVEASVDPDRNPLHAARARRGEVRRPRVRHHDPPPAELMRLLWKARYAYLDGRPEDAVWRLGRALHYVQDAHVRTGPMFSNHDRAEADIARMPVDPEVVMFGLRSAVVSPHFVRSCLGKARPVADPRGSLDGATMLSASIAAATLGARAPSPTLLSKWRREGVRHRYLVLPLAFGVPVALAAVAFLGGEPHFSVLAIPFFLVPLAADSRYYFDRDEAGWFGLTI